MEHKEILVTGYGGCCQSYIAKILYENNYTTNWKKKFKGSKHLLNLKDYPLHENQIFLFVYDNPFYMLISHLRRNTLKPYDYLNCWLISHMKIFGVKNLRSDKLIDIDEGMKFIRENNYKDIYNIEFFFENVIKYYKDNPKNIIFLNISDPKDLSYFSKTFKIENFRLERDIKKYDKFKEKYSDIFDHFLKYFIKVKNILKND